MYINYEIMESFIALWSQESNREPDICLSFQILWGGDSFFKLSLIGEYLRFQISRAFPGIFYSLHDSWEESERIEFLLFFWYYESWNPKDFSRNIEALKRTLDQQSYFTYRLKQEDKRIPGQIYHQARGKKKSIERNRGLSFFYPLETEQRIISHILEGKKESLGIVENMFQKNQKMKLSNEEWSNFISAIIRTFKRIFMELNKSESNFIPSGEPLGHFIARGSRAMQLEHILILCTELLSWTREASGQGQAPMMEGLVGFVQTHYQNPDLSLIDLAQHFNCSSTYISRIFKQYAGRNFKDLLGLERVRACKELVKADQTITLSILCQKTGFNNSTTLIRTFKKYTGITPGRYSQNCSEKQLEGKS